MCMKLKEIHKMQPHNILERYCQQSFDKVDILDILKRMKIQCHCVDFSSLESTLFLSGNDNIQGIAYSEGNDLKILYSNKLNQQEINYTLAHELAHCCLHLPVSADFHVEMKTRVDYYSYNSFLFIPKKGKRAKKKEIDADKFAANLLIPTSSLMNYLMSNSDLTSKSIAKHFDVPVELVYKKIELLNRKSKVFMR